MNQRQITLPAIVLSIMAVSVLPGCGNGTLSVTGKVTLDGEPLSGATVVFIPTEQEVTNSVATTGEDGEFALNYTSTAKGAMPGKYLVQITKPLMTETGEKPTLPAKYHTESKLEAEVKAGGDNHFVFDLKSD